MSVHASTVYFAHCSKCQKQSPNYSSVVRCDTWLKNHYWHKHGIKVPVEDTSRGSGAGVGFSIGGH